MRIQQHFTESNGSDSGRTSWSASKMVIWDEAASRAQQVLEMKLQLRLSRIEEECAKFRKPARIKGSSRSHRDTTPEVLLTGSRLTLDDLRRRFDWIIVDLLKSQASCECCSKVEQHIPDVISGRGDSEFRWSLGDIESGIIIKQVELHQFSAIHLWSRRSMRCTEEGKDLFQRSSNPLISTDNNN